MQIYCRLLCKGCDTECSTQCSGLTAVGLARAAGGAVGAGAGGARARGLHPHLARPHHCTPGCAKARPPANDPVLLSNTCSDAQHSLRV